MWTPQQVAVPVLLLVRALADEVLGENVGTIRFGLQYCITFCRSLLDAFYQESRVLLAHGLHIISNCLRTYKEIITLVERP